MGPLQPHLADVVVGLVCFFVIFAVLGGILLPRIEKTLAAREDAIGGGTERADAARAEAHATYEQTGLANMALPQAPYSVRTA
ncbi:hypothetical protein [Kitasatospora acidiphila]|uniref:hypothetical protein n=1 Tax=Kitasatospora acidiphila TaxID=2567942 RepID=UPI003C766CC2